jgi:hypothetical protein
MVGCWFCSVSRFSATNSSGQGIPQERFPYQGRYPPTTWPDPVEDDGDDDNVDGVVVGTFSDRCISGSGAVWAFCLASGGFSGVF